MGLFSRCPKCGKTHIFQPAKCGCGYDFKEGEKQIEGLPCPRCQEFVKFTAFECAKCHTEVNKLFRYPCPKCGKKVGIKDKYCECGKELIVEMARCGRCKAEIRADSIACPNCGVNFYNREHTSGGDDVHRERWVCPRCGSEVEGPTMPCYVCQNW